MLQTQCKYPLQGGGDEIESLKCSASLGRHSGRKFEKSEQNSPKGPLVVYQDTGCQLTLSLHCDAGRQVTHELCQDAGHQVAGGPFQDAGRQVEVDPCQDAGRQRAWDPYQDAGHQLTLCTSLDAGRQWAGGPYQDAGWQLNLDPHQDAGHQLTFLNMPNPGPSKSPVKNVAEIENLRQNSSLVQYIKMNFEKLDKASIKGSLFVHRDAWRQLTSDPNILEVVEKGYSPLSLSSHHPTSVKTTSVQQVSNHL